MTPRLTIVKQQSALDTTINDIADSMAPRHERAFLSAVRGVKDDIDRRAFESAVRAQNLPDSLEALLMDTFDERLAPLVEASQETLTRGGRHAADALGATIAFDVFNPRAVAYIQEHGAELVREISDTTRTSIKNVLLEGFNEGLSPPQMSRRILGVGGEGGRLGLTNHQQGMVRRYNDALNRAVAGELSLDELEARFSLSPVGRGRGRLNLVRGNIDKATRRYEERLLRHRAKVIAHHESLTAANAGQHEAWQQARDRGVLTGEQEREWLTAEDERVCTICIPLDGQKARLGEPFASGIGNPPAHIGCRCTTVLVFDDRAPRPKPKPKPRKPRRRTPKVPPRLPKYRNRKTMAGAEKYAEETLGIKGVKPLGIKGVDVDSFSMTFQTAADPIATEAARLRALNMVNRELTDLKRRFPNLPTADIETLVLRKGAGGQGSADHWKFEVSYLKTARPLTAAEKAKQAEFVARKADELGIPGLKYSVSGDELWAEGSVAHELGHVLTTEARYKRFRDALRVQFGERPVRGLRQDLANAHPGQRTLAPKVERWVQENISLYGSTDMLEVMAEGFALYTQESYVKGTLPAALEAVFDDMLGVVVP